MVSLAPTGTTTAPLTSTCSRDSAPRPGRYEAGGGRRRSRSGAVSHTLLRRATVARLSAQTPGRGTSWLSASAEPPLNAERHLRASEKPRDHLERWRACCRPGLKAAASEAERMHGSGGPLSYDAAHHRWEGYCSAAGVDIHQLRHAHATSFRGVHQGCPPTPRPRQHRDHSELLDDKVADAEIRAARRRRDNSPADGLRHLIKRSPDMSYR